MRWARLLLSVAVAASVIALPTMAWGAEPLPSSTTGDISWNVNGFQTRTWWTATEGTGSVGTFHWADSNGVTYTADLKCLAVLNGTDAYFAGPIVAASDPSYNGYQLLTRVFDGASTGTTDVIWNSAYQWDTCINIGQIQPSDGPFPAIAGDLMVSYQGMSAASLSLAATPKAVSVGDKVTLSGSLAVASGTPNEQTVTVTRSMNGGGSEAIASVATGIDGSYSLNDSPPLGTAAYTASFAGTDTILPASATVSVVVSKRTSSLTLATAAQTLTLGRSTTLTARLTGGEPGAVISFYAKPVGGATTRIAQKVADGSRKASIAVRPARTTTYTAAYAGSGMWGAATSGAARVSVRARWTGKALGGYATSGHYRLYRYTSACPAKGQGCPTAWFALAPKHPGVQVGFEFQFYYKGSWRSERDTFRLTTKGDITIYTTYRDRSIIGLPVRERFTFSGDRDHLQGVSAWVYWKVTA
jgi:hypothetical protein